MKNFPKLELFFFYLSFLLTTQAISAGNFRNNFFMGKFQALTLHFLFIKKIFQTLPEIRLKFAIYFFF